MNTSDWSDRLLGLKWGENWGAVGNVLRLSLFADWPFSFEKGKAAALRI